MSQRLLISSKMRATPPCSEPLVRRRKQTNVLTLTSKTRKNRTLTETTMNAVSRINWKVKRKKRMILEPSSTIVFKWVRKSYPISMYFKMTESINSSVNHFIFLFLDTLTHFYMNSMNLKNSKQEKYQARSFLADSIHPYSFFLVCLSFYTLS